MSVNNVFNLAAWTLKAVYISQFVDTLFGPNGLDFESVSSYFFTKVFFKKKTIQIFQNPFPGKSQFSQKHLTHTKRQPYTRSQVRQNLI